MRSTPRQSLDYFFRVSELGSIRAAADQLRIAPSAVSRKIAQLEFEYGVDLFVRQARGVQLTEAGATLFRHLAEVRTLDTSLNQALSDIRGLRQGLVRIAMGSGFLREFVTDSFREFLLAYPRIRVDVVSAPADEIIESVLTDVSEIGVVFGAIHDQGVNVIIDAERPISFIISPNHPLADAAEITLEQMSKIPLALPPLNSGIRQVIDKAFHSVGISVEPVLTLSPVEALIQFAVMGAGGTFLPNFSCRKELNMGVIRAISVPDGPMLSTKAVMFTRQDRHLSPAAVALLDVVENTLI